MLKGMLEFSMDPIKRVVMTQENQKNARKKNKESISLLPLFNLSNTPPNWYSLMMV